jgi:hypothetical protein
MPGAEGDYARLRANGVSHDEAIMEIAARRAVAKERKKLDAASEHLARTARALAADRREVRGERMALLSGRSGQRRPLPISRAKHGSNPFENDGFEFEDLSLTLPPWSEEEPQALLVR